MSSIFQTPELALGIAVGGAAGAAFEPKLEVPKQKAWDANRVRIPDLGLIAALVAGGKVTPESGHNMANRLGYSNGTMDSITWLAQNRLDFAAMLRLWRLFPDYTTPNGLTIGELVDETLAHEQLDWNYHELLTKLRHAELPGIGDIAYSVVRGYLPTNIKLPVPPPATSDYVPRFPQSKTLAEDLAARLGFDKAMLELMIARSGLSMAPVMAAQSLFRSDAAIAIRNLPAVPGVAKFNVEPYVGPADYKLAISEGDLRTEWAHAVQETAREILTAGQYAELELRGYIDKPTRRALTAQHGMRDFDSDLLYDVQGRGLSLHSAFISERRGGVFKGPTADIPEWAMFQLQRGNLRPEVYNLAWAGRHSYPSAFVIRALLQGGAISEAEGDDLFLKIGWPSGLATKVAKHYGAAGVAKADPHVTKAQNHLWTVAQTSYIAGETDAAAVTAALPHAGVAATAIPEVLAVWNATRTLVRKQLTPAQVKKAYAEAVLNEETGSPWTRDEALAELIARGYAPDRADTFLRL